LEHVVVLEVFRTHYVYYDAVMLGVTGFLTITALGSFSLRNRALTAATVFASLCAIATILVAGRMGAWASGLSLFVLTVVTGSLFPTFFERNPSARLAIFAMDAVGSAAGSLLAFFVPILFGFAAFRLLGLSIFVATATVMLLGWLVRE
jgi:hypothetical protein